MHANHHDLHCLFSQLGLSADSGAIEAFISQHRPLPCDVPIYRAAFWTASQKSFLIEGLIEDADWASSNDELNSRLRDWPFHLAGKTTLPTRRPRSAQIRQRWDRARAEARGGLVQSTLPFA